MNVLGLVWSLVLSFMMALSNNSPSARAYPFIASAGNLVYLWGGRGDTEPEAVFLFHRDTKTWARQRTRGPHPPARLKDGCCCISGQHLYIYGGVRTRSHNGVLYELNINSWTWRKLSDGDTGGPGKKSGCRMIPYQDQLLVVGGAYDEMPNSRQAGAHYEREYTNEVHSFNLTTGQWSSPSMKGSRPPPCAAFSLTVTDEDQAVMFGGFTPSGFSSEAHVLHLPTMTWSEHKEGDPWPKGRQYHIAACLGYGGQHKTVLISGGWSGRVTLDDMWLLDLQSGRIEEVQVPGKHKKLIQRCYHGAATLTINSDCVEVILFGGRGENHSIMADTTILMFERQASAPEGVSPAQRWILLDPDQFVWKRQQKLEVSGADASKRLKENKIQSSRGDPDIARDDVDQGQETLANMQDIVSTASFEKMSDLDEDISQSSERSSASLVTQDFADDVIKAVHQNEQIERKMANIILKGLPEAGKTTLLNRLLNRPFQHSSSSTGLSDGIVVVDIEPTSTLTSAATASDNSSWEVMDFEKSTYSQLKDFKRFLPSAGEESDGNTTIDSPSYEVVRVSSKTEVSENNIREVLSAHNIKSIEDLKFKNSLYIRDTGGQVEFQESLTLLLQGPSIFVFVLRMDIDIHKKVTIRYRLSRSKSVNEYKSSISTVDALVQFLTSVSAIDTTERKYKSHEPVVFIVATHIDRLKSTPRSVIAETNKSLDDIICEHGFSNVVHYADAYNSKVMYTVDNTSKEDDDFKIIRSDINGYICYRQEFMVLYPVGFLLFCLELQNIKAAVISIAKFRELASNFSITTSRQIDCLLHFLHFRIGIIQYYDIDNLSDIVIKEPQVLFNKVTELLMKTFLSSQAMKMNEQRSFQQKGILDAAVLESILGGSKNQITAKQFLAYMVHLRLAVPFTDKSGIRKYFFPCVLNHVQASVAEERKTDIAPLAICFELGHCPQGLFGVLISHLVSPAERHKVSFNLSKDKIYQDQVVLLVSSPEDRDEMSLKKHLSHIEVTMYYDSSPVKEFEPSSLCRGVTISTVCTTVRSILEHCLQLSMNTLRYDDKKLQTKFCLSCPKRDCAIKHHEVEYGEKQTSHFMFCKQKKCAIPSSGEYWFHQALLANDSAPEKTQCAQSSANEKSSSSTGERSKFDNLKQKAAACCTLCWPIFLSVAVPILAVLLIIMLNMSSKQDIIPTIEPAKYLLRDSRPRIQNLLFLRCGSKELEIISEVASMCNTFGYLLNLNRHTVKTEWDIPGASVHSKCQNIVDHWLDGKGTKGKHGKPVTWMTLIEALREFGKHWLADSLEKCIN